MLYYSFFFLKIFHDFIVYILFLIIYLEEDKNKKRPDVVFMNQMVFWEKKSFL